MPDHATLDPQVRRELDAIDTALAGGKVEPDLQSLAELALLVRAERPLPPAGVTAELDARVARRLSSSGGALRRGGLARGLGSIRGAWLPVLGVAASLLLAFVVVGGALRSGGGDDAAPEGSGRSASAPAADSAGGAEPQGALGAPSSRDDAAGGSLVPGSLAPGPAGGPSDRRSRRLVERSAALTLEAPRGEVERVADAIVRTTDAVGGFVASSTVGSLGTGDGGGSFELRVPAARLARALAELSRLAHVRERSQSAQDITAARSSAAERVEDARAERRGLLRQLERATTLEQTSRIKARVRAATRRLSAAKASLGRVRARAAFATISVSLVADSAASAGGDDGRWSPGEALDTAVRVLEVAVGVLLVAAAIALPLVAVAAVTAVAVRTARSRRRRRALDAAA